jgi:hypothetical protein
MIVAFAWLCCNGRAWAQQDSTQTAADSLLLKQLEHQLAASQANAPQTAARVAPSTNPNLGVIGDFRASYLAPARRHFEAELHETEISLQSVVDPYVRADFFVSLARHEESGEFGVELEEAFLTTQTLPGGLQLKLGKFRGAFGKINVLHPHALPYADLPLMYASYLGEEGLNDEGASLSWLVPNPLNFYQELTLEATRGPSESASFTASAADRFLYLGHLKNFWDLTPNATLELGFTGLTGQNDAAFSTAIGGLDLTYKWKPLRFNTYKSFVLQIEALFSSKKISGKEKIRTWGAYALSTYQIGKRWFLTGRFDYANTPDHAAHVARAYSGVLGWQATEFQKAELQLKTTSSNGFERVYQVLLRSIFAIGAHGAHAY